MNRDSSWWFLGVLLTMLLASCASDTVAGKTTTTGNGGGLTALGPDGRPAAGAVVLAARQWDAQKGIASLVDTLHCDSSGSVTLGQEGYLFLEVFDRRGSMGALARLVSVPEGSRMTVVLDTLRTLRGRVGAFPGRMILDSSFHSTEIQFEGTFVLDRLPLGEYGMLQADSAGRIRERGRVRLNSGGLVASGTDLPSLAVSLDTALWIDDFESGTNIPLVHDRYPGSSPWYVWSVGMTQTVPSSSAADSLAKAIGTDSIRAGKVFHARFTASGSGSWFTLGVAGLSMDLASRAELCLAYRSDARLDIQVQRDSVGSIRPAATASVPASLEWRETCLETTYFVVDPGNPEALRTWDAFAKRILVIEFQVPGGSFLDLDDVRFR